MDSTLFSTLLVLFVVSLTRQQVNVNSPDCGLSRIQVSPASERIVGGEEAAVDQFPWLGILASRQPNQEVFRPNCTAVVIHREWLLTSGHCCWAIESDMEIAAFVGNPTVNRTYVSGANYSIARVENLYNLSINVNDVDNICLLKTVREIDFISSSVNSICLPSEPSELNTSENFVVAGFTPIRNSASSIYRPHVIRQNRIIRHDQCKAHADEILGRHDATFEMPGSGVYLENLNGRVFCRQSMPGEGLCGNDRGAPMMIRRDDKWTLVGFFYGSISSNVAIVDYPCDFLHLFINVSWYLPWIYSRVGDGVITTTLETPPTDDFFYIVGFLVAFLALLSFVWVLWVICLKRRKKEKTRKRKRRSSDSEKGSTRTGKSTSSGSFTVSSTSKEETEETTGSLEPLEKRVPRLQRRKTPKIGQGAEKKKPVKSVPLPKSTKSTHYSLEKLTFSSENE